MGRGRRPAPPHSPQGGSALLSVSGLRTVFRTAAATSPRWTASTSRSIAAARSASSARCGCGKSVLSLSVMRLVPPPGRIAAGQIMFDGRNLLDLSLAQMRDIRGNRIAMIFQEPMTSLNPVFTVGDQITEAMRAHDRTASAGALRSRAIAALQRVRIPAPERRFDEYPHQMSGGMRQRVMIAMALACEPDLLIADEPTTALDVTVQAQILDLLRELQQQTGMAIILITHDLGIVAEMADEVAVMYAGRVVERAPGAAIFDDPQHPYTLGLLGSIPKIDENRDRLLAIEGTVPPPFDLPQGCRFHPRCVFADAACTMQDPDTAPARRGPSRRLHPRPGARRVVRPWHERAAGSRRPDQALHRQARPGVRQDGRRGARGGRHLVQPRARRDAGAGGRVRLRQVHHRAAACCG